MRGEDVDMNARFTTAEGVHARRFHAELVVAHLGRGEYFGLNETGAEVWERLTAGASPAEIAGALSTIFDGAPSNVEEDVRAVVASLLARGLIVRKPTQ